MVCETRLEQWMILSRAAMPKVLKEKRVTEATGWEMGMLHFPWF